MLQTVIAFALFALLSLALLPFLPFMPFLGLGLVAWFGGTPMPDSYA